LRRHGRILHDHSVKPSNKFVEQDEVSVELVIETADPLIHVAKLALHMDEAQFDAGDASVQGGHAFREPVKPLINPGNILFGRDDGNNSRQVCIGKHIAQSNTPRPSTSTRPLDKIPPIVVYSLADTAS